MLLYYFVILITYIFDFFVIITFMDGILDKSKRKLALFPYMSCFIIAESILFFTEKISIFFLPTHSLHITLCISFTFTLIFTFLYNAAMTTRIVASVFFQIFVLLGETIFTFTFQYIQPEILDINMMQLSILINLGSKITLYIFVIISIIIWKKRIQKYELTKYYIPLFTTPLFTFIIIIGMPIKSILETDNTSFFFFLCISLSFFNITNYLLIDKITCVSELKKQCQQMEQQVKYQREKYTQLGSYYKNMRSIIHDMKNHYFMITRYIENEEYSKLQDYMQNAIQKMEACHTGINTGNLVIDAFVSNFKMLSENNNILFRETISIIPDKIPLTDYELCVVIGNLLDNAYQAASIVKDREKYIDLHIYISDSDSFIIYEKNTYNFQTYNTSKKEKYEHGYGLSNINKIIENKHGIMQYKPLDDYFEITLIIPIIDLSKRIRQPAITPNI